LLALIGYLVFSYDIKCIILRMLLHG